MDIYVGFRSSEDNRAIPGMKLGKSKGGYFRIADGYSILNLGSARLEGVGTLSGTPMRIGTPIAEVTETLASVDEMVASGGW